MANIDNLNFKVILDDKDFNTRVEADIKLAEKLNTQLSKLLQAKVNINKISAQDAANAKRASDIAAKQAIDQERIRKAAELAAAAEEKKRTQAEKTNNEIRKGATESAKAAKEQQRTATEAQRTAAAANQAAVNAQRFRTEQQRTATEAQRTATATQNTARATANAQLAQKRLADYSKQTTRQFQTQSRLLNELKGYALGYLSIHGASQLLSSLVRVTGEFELQKTTLAAMLGDLNKAEGIITRIQGLAVESPFQFKELTTYAKQLSAFSVPAQELYDTTKMLADISAGLGVGMDRIVLAYGQVRSAAFLRGQEVRQFTEAGIPILDELAKQFSELEGRAVSTSEVFDKISKRLVPFEMVAKVFKDMTSEGGKFYNMQEVQAETLRGKISNLKDAYEVMLNEIGKGQSENLKGAVDWARRLMQNYEETGRTLVELVAAYGVYKTALIALTAATGTFELANHKLLSSLVKAGQWAVKNPYVIIAAGLTAVGYAVYKASTQLEPYERIMKSLSDTTSSFTKSMTTETAKLDAFYAKLELAKEGTEAYADAKKAIYSQYAAYISELQNEGIAVDNLANIYDKLKIKIIDSQKARFREVALRDIDKEYEYQTNALLSEAERATKRIIKKLPVEFSALEKEAVQAYVAGTMSMSDIAGDERLKGLASILTNAADSGNRAWEQFGLSIETARAEFELATQAYTTGLNAIDEIYGKAQNTASAGLNPFVYNLTEGGGKGKSPAQKAIEEQIRSVQKLQDAYEKLMPYLNEVQMKSTLKSLFPNIEAGVIDSLDFDAELTRLADKLEEFDKDAAQRLRDTIGKDVAGTIAESFRAVEQYKKMMDSWLGEDFTLSGKGVSFDISKIVRDLNNRYAQIDQKRLKSLELLKKAEEGDAQSLAIVREYLGEEAWNKYLTKGRQVIDELTQKEKRAARDVANEKIRDKASEYVSEEIKNNNIDLSDFNDKTISQIQTLIDRLKTIRDKAQSEANKAFADVVLGKIDEGQYAKWQMLLEVIELLGIKIEDTEEELDKKMIDKAKEAMDAIGSLGSEISNLGSAIEDSDIQKFGEDIQDVTNFASGLIEAMKSKDTIAIIANIVSYAISSITDVVNAAIIKEEALYEATIKLRDAIWESMRDSTSGIWGTDEIALAKANIDIATQALENYKKKLNEFEKIQRQRDKYNEDSILFPTKVDASLSDIVGLQANLGGWELYRENGELNIDALSAYYDSYKNELTRKQKLLVKSLIESGEAYNDAAAQQAEYLTSLFGGVADDIATSMVDAFIESGDAAIDMGNIISDVSKDMVADLIKSVYLMPILNSYTEQFKAIDASTPIGSTENTEQKLNLLETALQEISGQSDAITETIERFADYLGTGEGAGTSDLGEGIKGITEDQANLLASYLNAIRADVSYSKTLWVKMDANLQRIVDMFTSSPTLMEYQAQIAANTYNTAIATQGILDKLGRVIGSGDDGDAIKIVS